MTATVFRARNTLNVLRADKFPKSTPIVIYLARKMLYLVLQNTYINSVRRGLPGITATVLSALRTRKVRSAAKFPKPATLSGCIMQISKYLIVEK